MPRILIVDDDPDVVSSMRDLLETSLSVEVLGAQSAGEAWRLLDSLEVCHAPDVDLVVCDYLMPRLDGLGFLDRVRRRSPEARMLLFTGCGDVPDHEGVPLLLKGEGPERLVQVVAALLPHKPRSWGRRRPARRWASFVRPSADGA